ncbi:COG4315 family predicted lipoprotein [Streptomyces chumphonensis]|uniref:COG4315 family predicted lipoprotein n=1 Tax=Streptomyces chumphonensis TaxID=1214925 RepID=UPI003D7238BA
MRRRTYGRTVTAGAAAAALLLGGCGDDGGDQGPPSPGDATGPATVAVESSPYGDILVGEDGYALYLFEADSPGASACTDACAEVWPPLTTDGAPNAGDGVDADLLGTMERADGTTGVTYDDHPLYFYEPDTEPGDVGGQAIDDFGGLWYVVGPDGEPIEDERPADEATDEPGPY